MTTTRFADMREIVVPLDGRDASVRAVPVAGRLAARLGLGIRLFGATAGDEDELARWMRTIADAHLPGVEVAIEVAATSEPVPAIVAAAEHGVVCMSTAASLRPHQGHVGSVAEGVARDLGRPVFMVGPDMVAHPGKPTQKVVVPVDGSPLSESALEIAGDVAAALRVPVWIVSVISQRAERAAAGVSHGMAAVEAGYVRGLARDLADATGLDVEYEVLHQDDPAAAIVDFAGADGTVVMSTHGRSGLSRVFAGSITTSVVAHSRRAVLVWRPLGIE